ncbi:MAG: hypothetical protein WKG07_03320 [Hymenobacter sp.]
MISQYSADKPGNNEGVATQFGSQYRTSNTPNGQVLYSPRLGFNWDVNNDSKVQLRGGTGIFTGRVPFVWLSNSYTNSGLIQGAVDQTGTPAVAATPTSPAVPASPTLPFVRLTPEQIATDYSPVPHFPD